jgi:hypothetical protein
MLNPNPNIENFDLAQVFTKKGPMRDDEVTFAGAGTLIAGTILARDSVSKKLIPFVKAGVTNEDGIPKYILHVDLVAAGAGDEPVRVAQSGEVNKTKLIILADGDDSNVDADVLDQLRNYIFAAKDFVDDSELDNQ